MKTWKTIVVALGLVMPLAAGADMPEPNAAYSAQRVMDAGGLQMTGKIHHDHGKERWERSQDGITQVMIMRPDLGQMIMYMPDLNMAMELPLEGGPQFGPPIDPNGPQPEAVGVEDVGGESTTKYRVDVDDGGGATMTVFSWVTDDGIVMRVEGKGADGDFATYLTEVSRGPQDAALFEVPEGAQTMPVNPALLQQLQ